MGLKDRKRGGGEKWGTNYEQKREIESEQENEIQMDGREKVRLATRRMLRGQPVEKSQMLYYHCVLSTVARNNKEYSEQCLNGTEPLDIIV